MTAPTDGATTGTTAVADVAARLVGALVAAGLTLAVAESLTGGDVASAVVSVPGSSQVFRGGAVTYATDTKASVLGVDAALLAANGAVDPQVASQMAVGVRALFSADVAVATTGVAGPTEQDGHPVGQVFVAVVVAGDDVRVREHRFAGDRAQVRERSVVAALEAVLDALRGNGAVGGPED